MRKYLYFLSLLPLFISGCGTPPARHLVEECTRTTPAASGARMSCLNRASLQTDELNKQAYVQSLTSRCESFGFARGTPAFNQCVFQQNQVETQNRATAESLRIQQEQLALQQMKQGLEMLSPSRPITCTRLPGSNTTTCQ